MPFRLWTSRRTTCGYPKRYAEGVVMNLKPRIIVIHVEPTPGESTEEGKVLNKEEEEQKDSREKVHGRERKQGRIRIECNNRYRYMAVRAESAPGPPRYVDCQAWPRGRRCVLRSVPSGLQQHMSGSRTRPAHQYQVQEDSGRS